MAITYRSGSVYTDVAGQLVTGKIKIAYIIFTPSSNGDEFTLHDGTSGSDPKKLQIHGDTGYRPVIIDLSASPMLFEDGIYCGTIDANCHLTLVLTSKGGA
jgi:hypothetical protein